MMEVIEMVRYDDYIFKDLRGLLTSPVASAIVFKKDDHVIAKVWDENHERWKRVARGRAGVDDAEVIQRAVDTFDDDGGSIYISSGIYKVNKGITIWQHGVKITADRISYGVKIVPQDDFEGNAVFEFKRPSGGVGLGWELRNIYIDFEGRDVAHGVVMYNPYDNVILENLRIVGVGDKHSALIIDNDPDNPATGVGQTLTAVNVYAAHKNKTATEPTVVIKRLQESVFINLKAFGATGGESSGSAVKISESKSLLFSMPSFASADVGVEIITEGERTTRNIMLLNPLFENITSHSVYANGSRDYPVVRLTILNPRTDGSVGGMYINGVSDSLIQHEGLSVEVGSDTFTTMFIGWREKVAGTGWYGNIFLTRAGDYYNPRITVYPELAISDSESLQNETVRLTKDGDVIANRYAKGLDGVVTKVDVGDYGGNFANYTPPAGEEGKMIIAIDTNSASPGKRLYVYANGVWNYVDLT